MTAFINIHAKKVPNPLAMCFVIDGRQLSKGAYTFRDSQTAELQSPLALKLLQLGFVEQVFISQNFVTVSKKAEEPEWVEVMPQMRILIKQHLESGEPLLLFDDQADPNPDPSEGRTGEIKALLDAKIRPATRQDGGDITFDSFENGVLKVNLSGACVGCPFAPRTIKSGVEVVMKQNFPDVKTVTSDMVNWGDDTVTFDEA